MGNNEIKIIDDFLTKLGEVPKDGFTIICNKCKSTDVGTYDDTGQGTEYTGAWGDAGIKCRACGNASEIISF